MDEAKPMTSVFHDVIRLEAVRGGLNVPIEGHLWRFLGNLNPKMLLVIVWTPQRHFLTSQSQRVFWAIVREIPRTGYFSRRVREKIKIKKRPYRKKEERPYISRISPGAPLRRIGINFGLHVRLVDVINCAKFHRNRLRGLGSVRGRSLTIPIRLRCRR